MTTTPHQTATPGQGPPANAYPALWIRPAGVVVGFGGSGPDPRIPTCPICGCYGGGGHGGYCPNGGMQPRDWLSEMEPERARQASLIPEDAYQASAAGAARRTDQVLRYARDEDDLDSQLVCQIEQAALALAEHGAMLRVIARWQASRDLPGAQPERAAGLVESWEKRAEELRVHSPALAQQLHLCAQQLREALAEVGQAA